MGLWIHITQPVYIVSFGIWRVLPSVFLAIVLKSSTRLDWQDSFIYIKHTKVTFSLEHMIKEQCKACV